MTRMIQVYVEGEVTKITMTGEMDIFHLPEVREVLQGVHTSHVVFDMRNVTFCDSMFFSAACAAQEKHGRENFRILVEHGTTLYWNLLKMAQHLHLEFS